MVVSAREAGLVFGYWIMLIYWDFSTQPSPEFIENSLKKKNYPVSTKSWYEKSEQNDQTVSSW